MVSRRYDELDWYETPHYYDIVFDAGTRSEADFLEAMARQYGRAHSRRVLEPACGSARLVRELARRGYVVTGFDQSEAMLAYAAKRLRERRLRAKLTRSKLESFRFTGQFDLAHCLVSTFKYLLDEQSARSHLRCVARSLAPSGIYVLGFHLTEYGSDRVVRERWIEKRGTTTVVCNTQVWPARRRARTEAVRTRLVVREGTRERRSETHWQFRTYDSRQVRALLDSVPALEHVATYDFTYRTDRTRELSDEQLDCVLILRKRVTTCRS